MIDTWIINIGFMNEEIFNPISESYKSEDGADLVQHVL